MAMMELQVDEKIARITMHGNGSFNADTLAEFNAALDTVEADENVDILLLSGEEKSFSQGLDLEFVMAQTEPGAAMAFVGDCMHMVGRLLTFPIPVASLVNGHAFGLGAMITLASDYKVMREDRGYFCLPEVDLGMTLTERMNALVCGKLSGKVLRDVLLTGKRVGGPEASSCGIVDASGALADLETLALAHAAPMRGKNRQALAGLKRGAHLDILAVIESDREDVTI